MGEDQCSIPAKHAHARTHTYHTHTNTVLLLQPKKLLNAVKCPQCLDGSCRGFSKTGLWESRRAGGNHKITHTLGLPQAF